MQCLCVLKSLYKWQWNYLKPISAFHCNIFLSASWLTQLHVSQLSLTPHPWWDTQTVAHPHAKDCTSHPHSIPSSQKMNEVDISLKAKLKMAIITLLPVHYSNNAVWLFVLDWPSPGVWPHNLILLAQTSLQNLCNFSTLFRSKQSTVFPQWDLTVPQIIQNVKQDHNIPVAKMTHTNIRICAYMLRLLDLKRLGNNVNIIKSETQVILFRKPQNCKLWPGTWLVNAWTYSNWITRQFFKCSHRCLSYITF